MQIFTATNSEILLGILTEVESKHCIRVLRKKIGDQIYITNGEGTLFRALITDANQRKCTFKIQSKEKYKQFSPPLHIAIAPTKSIDRFEYFLEKVTEIGVSEITPIVCDHSERKIIKEERLNKIITSACKQSKNFYFPKLNKLTSIKEIFGVDVKNKLIAHCSEKDKVELKTLTLNEETILLIGPEGDFSNQEIEQAIRNGFRPVSLGKSRLRTETAGVVACTIVNLNYEK
jgi:16S rRNA (uracil1498-N3)-methyltransferase